MFCALAEFFLFLLHLTNVNTHRIKNRRGGDGVRREMLELHTVMEAERPHEVTRRRTEAVAMELGQGDHVPLGSLGTQWSAAGAIHSGRDEEMWGRRSPSFSKSSSRCSVIDDGRQSSVATSLTGILRDEGRRLRCYVLEGARAREDGKGSKGKNDGGRRKAEGVMAERPDNIYRWPTSNRQIRLIR